MKDDKSKTESNNLFREENIKAAARFLRDSAGEDFRDDLSQEDLREKAQRLCEVFPEPYSRKLVF